MKKPGLGETIALICGTLLLALNLFYQGAYTSYEAVAASSRLFDFIVMFCFFGTLISLSWLFASWKNRGVRALLPLVIIIVFTWLSIAVPKMVFPPRDPLFFEAHYTEYCDSIKAFTGSQGKSLAQGRYSLPTPFQNLSEDGKVWVIAEGGRVDYFFLYECESRYKGVVFTKDDELIFRFSNAGPISGHPGWYEAEYYRTLLK